MKIKEIKNEKSLLINLRQIRDKISNELKDKSADQIVEFLKSKKTLHPISVWEK